MLKFNSLCWLAKTGFLLESTTQWIFLTTQKNNELVRPYSSRTCSTCAVLVRTARSCQANRRNTMWNTHRVCMPTLSLCFPNTPRKSSACDYPVWPGVCSLLKTWKLIYIKLGLSPVFWRVNSIFQTVGCQCVNKLCTYACKITGLSGSLGSPVSLIDNETCLGSRNMYYEMIEFPSPTGY